METEPDPEVHSGQSQNAVHSRKTDTMSRYLILFDDGAMDHISEQELPAVGDAARAVVRRAKSAGIWIFGCGMQRQRAHIVATDGSISNGPLPETKAVVGGFSIIEVPTREDAFQWAAEFAQACRCAQEVREILYDPES
jgi:hypothetical protein